MQRGGFTVVKLPLDITTAAESAIGKQLKAAFVNEVADTSEKIAANTLHKLRIESKQGVIAEAAKKVTNWLTR